jgi:hypothetical protein
MKCRLTFPIPDDEADFLTFFETLDSWPDAEFFPNEETCDIYVDNELVEPLCGLMATRGFNVISQDTGDEVEEDLQRLLGDLDDLVDGLESCDSLA